VSAQTGSAAQARGDVPGAIPLEGARWLLVTVFLVAGIWKLIGHADFRNALAAMGFFPPALVSPLSWCVPVAEVGASALTAQRRTQAAGLLGIIFMSACFAGLHGYVYVNGIVVACGCAGIEETGAGATRHLVMGVLCALLAIAGLCCLLLLPGATGATTNRVEKAQTRPQS